MKDILRWFEDYAAHLRVGAESFDERGLLPEFLAACQEFDSTLRAFDTERLKAAVDSSEGRRLVADLAEAQARFQAAATAHRSELDARQNDVRKGARALRGYTQAGVRGGTDATYLSRRG